MGFMVVPLVIAMIISCLTLHKVRWKNKITQRYFSCCSLGYTLLNIIINVALIQFEKDKICLQNDCIMYLWFRWSHALRLDQNSALRGSTNWYVKVASTFCICISNIWCYRKLISDASCGRWIFWSEIGPKLMFLEYLAFKAIFKSKAELEIHLGK